MSFLFGLLLAVTGIFLILLVLVQRGRGGGLTGALGGMGGQSAFGAKAGDVFTRITIGAAAVWILLCVLSVKMLGSSRDKLSEDLGGAAVPTSGPFVTEPVDATGSERPAGGTGASGPASGRDTSKRSEGAGGGAPQAPPDAAQP